MPKQVWDKKRPKDLGKPKALPGLPHVTVGPFAKSSSYIKVVRSSAIAKTADMPLQGLVAVLRLRNNPCCPVARAAPGNHAAHAKLELWSPHSIITTR